MLLGFVVLIEVDTGSAVLLHDITWQQLSDGHNTRNVSFGQSNQKQSQNSPWNQSSRVNTPKATRQHMCSLDATSGGSSQLIFRQTQTQTSDASDLTNGTKIKVITSNCSTVLTSQSYPHVTWTPHNSSHLLPDSALPKSGAYGIVLSVGEERERKKTGQKGAKKDRYFHWVHPICLFSHNKILLNYTTRHGSHTSLTSGLFFLSPR